METICIPLQPCKIAVGLRSGNITLLATNVALTTLLCVLFASLVLFIFCLLIVHLEAIKIRSNGRLSSAAS